MSALIVKGNIRKLHKRTERVRAGRSANGAISTTFSGNARAALATTNTDRTLGASTRQGWRLSVTAQERKAHGSAVTRNSAEYVASPYSMATVTATKRDSLGRESIPAAQRLTVPFETRRNHQNFGERA